MNKIQLDRAIEIQQRLKRLRTFIQQSQVIEMDHETMYPELYADYIAKARETAQAEVDRLVAEFAAL